MSRRRAAILLLLAVYVLFLLDLALLQFPTRNPITNVVPLRSIVADWKSGGRDFVVNFLGNIVAFIPIGMIPRLARPRRARAWHAALLSLSLSALIEGVQYATGRRVADVDDLILNTTGGVLGHWASHSASPHVAGPATSKRLGPPRTPRAVAAGHERRRHPGRTSPGRSRIGRSPRGRRQDHRVDDVDHAVGALDVGLDDLGPGDRDGVTLEGVLLILSCI